MKTNNVIITLGANNAILMTENSFAKQGYKAFSASTSFIAGLQALDFILDKVSNNDTLDEKVSTIHVPDMLKGFAGHSFREYIRTNKTSSGRAFTEEEKQLVLSVATKMMNKGLNCELKESKFFPKELKAMKDLALKTAKEYKSQAPQQTAPQAQPQQDPIALIGIQIAEAAAAGDMDKVMALTTALNALKAAQQPAPQAPVVEEEPEEETTDESDVEVDEELADMDC
jgi:glycerophosphoryl diester phosphodiesterase